MPDVLNHPWITKESNASDDADNFFVIPKEKIKISKDEEPSIDNLNIENLFFPSSSGFKLKSQDYSYISNDFYSHHISNLNNQIIGGDAVKVVESFGYPKSEIMRALEQGEMNHATASYNLLELT